LKKYTYNFEIKDLLTQFVAAFDDTIIKRYNKNREAEQEIAVRYVMAPKQRIMYDIVNKAQNIKLPVVSIDLASVSYDTDRVFNKLDGFDNYGEGTASAINTPVPVNLEVNMSILCRYMSDMDQIISNFVPYANPYIVLAWREPVDQALLSAGEVPFNPIEIRSEVLWSQSISMNTPKDSTYSEKFRITADTSFTIKGWLFRNKNETSNPIYFIDTNFINTAPDYSYNAALTSLDYESFSASLTADANIETVSLSGYPTTSTVFYNASGYPMPIDSPVTITSQAKQLNKANFTLIGENYDETEFVLLSSTSALTDTLTSVPTTYTGTIDGYLLPLSSYTVQSDTVMNIDLSNLNTAGTFQVVVKNPAGWTSTGSISGVSFTTE
tara:strand:+ start:442 stop:1590 length:1149 start_codon:yes stop_codon:yes gene_type:complete